jgi:hypothetical protein
VEAIVSEEEMAKHLCLEQSWAKGREKDIVSWLENFDPSHRALAIKILHKVKVHSTEDCQRWCQKLHSKLPEEIRNSSDTFYVGLGLPSESGSLVSYYYRTINGLAPEMFLDFREAADPAALEHRRARNLIFLDDSIGSGNQAIEFWQKLSSLLGRGVDGLNFYYLAFLSRGAGKENVEKHTRFKVNVMRELNESDEAFGSGSAVFEDGCREIAKEIFWKYGFRLEPKLPLGFREGQLLIAFDHNVPNNTLPVLWSSADNWFPLFKRYDKVHLSFTSKPKAIMFVEQVSLTPSIAGRSTSETARAISEQRALTAEEVKRYGGAIVESFADKALIQFSSFSDAMGCGFALQQRVKERNNNQTNNRLVFELRVAIDSGEVAMTPDGNLVGAAIDRAARICSVCPPEEVYFTEMALSEISNDGGKYSLVGTFQLKSDQVEKENIYRLTDWPRSSFGSPNPFIWRAAITTTEDFFYRSTEQRIIQEYLRARQNCQIVGPPRIGKTSLLRQVERLVRSWEGLAAEIAYIDLRSPRSFTLAGWLEHTGQQLNLAKTPGSLADFNEAIESVVFSGRHPILLLDQFEDLSLRPTEFTSDFFATLRSCGSLGLSIITASRRPLNEVSGPSDSTSPFHSAFPLLSLGIFSEANVEDFVKADREGMMPFTDEEREIIRRFAKGHPLALQVASFHVLEARRKGASLAAATRRANDDMQAYLPSW